MEKLKQELKQRESEVFFPPSFLIACLTPILPPILPLLRRHLFLLLHLLLLLFHHLLFVFSSFLQVAKVLAAFEATKDKWFQGHHPRTDVSLAILVLFPYLSLSLLSFTVFFSPPPLLLFRDNDISLSFKLVSSHFLGALRDPSSSSVS